MQISKMSVTVQIIISFNKYIHIIDSIHRRYKLQKLRDNSVYLQKKDKIYLSTKEYGSRNKIPVRVTLDTVVESDDMQQVEHLSLVLVYTLNLNRQTFEKV